MSPYPAWAYGHFFLWILSSSGSSTSPLTPLSLAPRLLHHTFLPLRNLFGARSGSWSVSSAVRERRSQVLKLICTKRNGGCSSVVGCYDNRHKICVESHKISSVTSHKMRLLYPVERSGVPPSPTITLTSGPLKPCQAAVGTSREHVKNIG